MTKDCFSPPEDIIKALAGVLSRRVIHKRLWRVVPHRSAPPWVHLFLMCDMSTEASKLENSVFKGTIVQTPTAPLTLKQQPFDGSDMCRFNRYRMLRVMRVGTAQLPPPVIGCPTSQRTN